jgi:outer membrane protein assembly factor BamB
MLGTAARLLAAAGVIVVLTGLPLSGAEAQAPGDWPTYLDNGARTGFNATETTITPSTAPQLTQLWTDTAGGSISAEPIQVGGVVYYGSWDGNEHAVDAATGAALWSTFVGQTTDTSCNPPTVGVASTATVDTITVNNIATEAVFVGGGDGNFYALDASTGAVIWKTELGTPPAFFQWSSPLLYNGSIYEGISSFGDCPLIQGGIVRMDEATGTVLNTLSTVPAGCTGASVWGSPTVDAATGDIYFGTGNPGSCSSPEPLAVAVVQTDSSLNLLGSWQVPAASQTHDSDFGSTPTLFVATISGVVHQMAGVENKNGVFYAFDRSSISSGPLWQKRIGSGGACPQCGRADISPGAYDGQHLFVAGGKTTIGGVKCMGSIRELRPSTGGSVWQDCLQSGPVLGAVTAVPGVAFVGAGNTVYAVGTSNGAILWSYQDTTSGSKFWGAPTISNGQVYVGNQDDKLYAFQLPAAVTVTKTADAASVSAGGQIGSRSRSRTPGPGRRTG